MPISLRMPPVLRPQVGGERQVEVSGATLREALDDLFAQFPAVRDQIVDADGCTLVGHVHKLDAGGHIEQFRSQMRRITGTGRRKKQFARPRLRQCDQFSHRGDGLRRMHGEDQRRRRHQRHRREIT